MMHARALLWLTFPLLLVACPAQNAATLTGLKTYDVGAAGDHRGGLISYDPAKFGLPPSGGPHNPAWQNCGVYDKPIATEHAVHSLEHGAVWIVYQESLPSTELDTLKSYVKDKTYTLLSPYPKSLSGVATPALPTPIVVSAWGVQKGYSSADPEIKTFIEKYAVGSDSKAPEKGAQCVDAIDTPDERAQ